MRLKVRRFLTSVNAANCYLCWCPRTRAAAIVDPAQFTAEMRGAIEEEGLELQVIYVTHGHFDHDGAVGALTREFDLQVCAGSDKYPGCVKLSGGETLSLGDVEIRVAAIPGHTDDSLAFIAEGAAFVGDALFAAAVGGTSNRAHFEQEVAGVRAELFSLPDDTILYTGHGPATTVAVERTYNPFFI